MELLFVGNQILTKFIIWFFAKDPLMIQIVTINSTLLVFQKLKVLCSRDFEAVLTAANSFGAVMGGSILYLTCKPANFQIMVFCVELCDGIIRIHLFRTTFLRFSYNPLLDVVPRDNGNKVYLFG